MNSNFFLQGSTALRSQLKKESVKYMSELENGADVARLQVIKQRMLALQAQLHRTMNDEHKIAGS